MCHLVQGLVLYSVPLSLSGVGLGGNTPFAAPRRPFGGRAGATILLFLQGEESACTADDIRLGATVPVCTVARLLIDTP